MNPNKQPSAPKPMPLTPDEARRALGFGLIPQTKTTR